MNNYEKFLLICIKNREILEFSEKEMASYLDNVTEKEYVDFEQGKYKMSEDNLKKIIRLLAIKNIKIFKLSDYIETKWLNEEEIEDLTEIVSKIVGDDNA